jgi:hypothetical protein
MADENAEFDLETEDQSGDDESFYEYSLTSYPTDFTLSVIFEQWKHGDILVPDYQRGYVWKIEQASKLIESFLIGLPIPQIFLYVTEDNKLLVIDGQQRITTIAYYLDGFFGDEHPGGIRKVFRLTGLSKKSPYAGKSFAELDASVQRKLKSAPLRAINIKQLKPAEEERSSVYEIFERLNTGGTPLKSQEIRNAVFRGHFNKVLKALNLNKDWRALLGREETDKHMRDVELLLRVFALTYYRSSYDGKMKQFLNVAMSRNRENSSEPVSLFEKTLPIVANNLFNKLPANPFRRKGPLNSAMLEAILTACLSDVEKTVASPLAEGYAELVKDGDFVTAISQATNTVERVTTRFARAKKLLLDRS